MEIFTVIYEVHAWSTRSTINEMKQQFISEFNQPKLKQHSIAKIKEIKQIVGNNACEYGERFWDLLSRVTYQIHYMQHKEWFIRGFPTMTIIPLMKERFAT